MNRKGLRFALVFVTALCLVGLLSCARDQQLVSMTIQPDAQGFLAPDPSLNAQLRAIGNYIHPPVQKDITDQVIWTSSVPDVATVTATGLLSPAGIDVCGGSLISATVKTNSDAGNRTSSGAIVTASIVATVDNMTVPGCPGFMGTANQPTLTVVFNGSGTGTVNSSPPGLGCVSPSSCSANFASGTTVTLTAAPTGASTFGSWLGCDSPAAQNPCIINSLTGNRSVTVTFNP